MNSKNEIEKENKQPLGSWSISMAVISLLFLPPLFGLIGFILGLIGVAQKEGSKSIIGLVLSVVFPLIGMFLGLLVLLW